MTTSIHTSAIIDPSAQIAEDVTIGPFVVIGPNCQIAPGCQLAPHAVLSENVRLAENVLVGSHAVLGSAPQDFAYKGETSWVEIGANTQIRESVTIHRATGEGAVTRVGQNCLLMATSHVGHNGQVGDKVMMANGAVLGGHVSIGDGAVIGGVVAIHQHVRIGKLVMMSGFSATRQDLPPFMTVDGCPALARGTNRIGLKRAGVPLESREALRRAYQLLWYSAKPMPEAQAELLERYPNDAYVAELVQFVATSKRGIHLPHRTIRTPASDVRTLQQREDAPDAGDAQASDAFVGV
ncbi:MAG: acyl-ACP--UDP-N-acetylglucosamine O-acyltransferase [Vampirovibrionales bacterium]|nr:acyl-ACP--UDP-N-acetylglucosamine O-acyltransferase [Vampirovibrionales bacterium]